MMASAAASILTSVLVVLVLVLMGSANSNSVCGKNCKPAHSTESCFSHVSELMNSSISPWTLRKRKGSEHSNVEEAVCTNCSDISLVAKPIYIRAYVLEQAHNDMEHSWCMCLREVAVGCTCVKK